MGKTQFLKYSIFGITTILTWELGKCVGHLIGERMSNTSHRLNIYVNEETGIIYSLDSNHVAFIIVKDDKFDATKQHQILIRDTSIKSLLATLKSVKEDNDIIVKDTKNVKRILKEMGRTSLS